MIVKSTEIAIFDDEIVKPNGFIRAKYHTWPTFKNGLVTCVNSGELTCLFQTGATSATSYFVVKACEVAAGSWQIIYSNELEEFFHVGTN